MLMSAPHGPCTWAGRELGGLDVLKGCSRLVYAVCRAEQRARGGVPGRSALAWASCLLVAGEVVMVNQGGYPWCEWRQPPQHWSATRAWHSS